MAGRYEELANWRQLGGTEDALTYRNIHMHNMLWDTDMNLDDYIIAAAPYAGAIAMMRNPERMTAFRLPGGGDGIMLYSATGALLGRITLEPSPVRGMAWTSSETLVVVYSTGLVDMFDAKGVQSRDGFTLFPPSARETVTDFAVTGCALCALSRSAADKRINLYLIYDLNAPVVETAGETCLPPGVPPTCMLGIDGVSTPSGRLEVLLYTSDASVVVVDSETTGTDEALDHLLVRPVLSAAVSPDAKFIATIDETGALAIIDSKFESKYLDLPGVGRPSQMVWCASDAVLVVLPEMEGGGVMLVGPGGDSLKYSYEGGVHLVQEIDGVRVITATHSEFIQRVPQHLYSIRGIGAVSPGSSLLLAVSQYTDGDAACDALMRELMEEDTLAAGVGDAITAAQLEWKVEHAQALLAAASYGKNFDPDIDATPFVTAAKKLRLLHALRRPEVGIPLTAPQLDALSIPALVDRLCIRHAHALALRMCDYVGLVKDKVLVHWACAKVKASAALADEAVRDLIHSRLKSCSTVSYADIAATADSAGRRRLATLLLAYEPRVADQVPILLRMREGALALERACMCGDTDLIHLCVMHLKRAYAMGIASESENAAVAVNAAAMPRGGGSIADAAATAAAADDPDSKFLRVVLQHPLAVSLLASLYREKDADVRSHAREDDAAGDSIPPAASLVRLYTASARYADAAQVRIRAAYRSTSLPERMSALAATLETLKEGEKANPRTLPAERASCAFYRSAVEEQLALLKLQIECEREHPDANFIDLSISETLFNLVIMGDNKRAAALKDTFKMSDTMFWYTKVRALAHARDWTALAKFADEKRSPIGYKPFAEACMLESANVEAKRYVARMTDYAERVDMLMALGLYTDAAELAAKNKDIDRLNAIGAAAQTPAAIDAVEKALASLTGGAAGRR